MRPRRSPMKRGRTTAVSPAVTRARVDCGSTSGCGGIAVGFLAAELLTATIGRGLTSFVTTFTAGADAACTAGFAGAGAGAGRLGDGRGGAAAVAATALGE